MANIAKQFDEVVLPDGTIASSIRDIERYLKANELAHSSDYSNDYYKNVRYKTEKHQKEQAFSDFIKIYKKEIWK